MELWNDPALTELVTSLTDVNVSFFLAGLAAGTLLWALAGSRARGPREATTLAARVDQLELRLAAGKNYASIIRAVQGVEEALPALAKIEMQPLVMASAIKGPRAKFSPKDRADPEQIAKEFVESLRDNSVAAAEIAKSIVTEEKNLNSPADRKKAAKEIKEFGKALSPKFWDTYGELMLQSNIPENLKAMLKTFYAQVKILKRVVGELKAEPSFAELDALLDRALDVLDTAVQIIEELNKPR